MTRAEAELRRSKAKARVDAWNALHPLVEIHPTIESLDLPLKAQEAWRALIIGKGCPCDRVAELILTPEQLRAMRNGGKIFTGKAQLEQAVALKGIQAWMRAHMPTEGPRLFRLRHAMIYLVAVDALIHDASVRLHSAGLIEESREIRRVSAGLSRFIEVAKRDAGRRIWEEGVRVYEELREVV